LSDFNGIIRFTDNGRDGPPGRPRPSAQRGRNRLGWREARVGGRVPSPDAALGDEAGATRQPYPFLVGTDRWAVPARSEARRNKCGWRETRVGLFGSVA